MHAISLPSKLSVEEINCARYTQNIVIYKSLKGMILKVTHFTSLDLVHGITSLHKRGKL
jgi:hypothetical protein